MRAIIAAVVLLLAATTQRLPAPILEETPRTTPRRSPKTKLSENHKKMTSTKVTSPTPNPQLAQKSGHGCAGNWHGTLPFGMFGDITPTLTVNQDGNAVTESGGLVPTFTVPASNDGKTVSWRTGIAKELQWTLTPASDGKTAVVRVHGSMFAGDHTAIFQKVSN